MSLYDAAKDAVKLAQKMDNVELVQKLLDVQEQALEMQEKQFNQNKKIEEQTEEIKRLKESKKFVFAEGHSYLVDPKFPDRHLCPVHTREYGFEAPLVSDNDYCGQCKRYYD